MLSVATAFAPSGRVLSRAVATVNMNVMPGPPVLSKSDKDVAATLAEKSPKLAAALSGVDLNDVTVFASTTNGDVSADAAKFAVSKNKQLPTRNGRSYVSIRDDEKEVGIKVTVDTCESFAMHGAKPPAKLAKVVDTIQCTNGFIHMVEDVLEPYDGNVPSSMFLKNTEDPNLSN